MDLPTPDHQRIGGRELSWLSKLLIPGPDGKRGLGPGFCRAHGTCKVSRLGRWEDPRELPQLNKGECSLNE